MTSSPTHPEARHEQRARNASLLRRLDQCQAEAAHLHWRNALVRENLGLVRLVANRESRRTGRCFEELCSAGYEGLIRAVEAFDSSRNYALSSFAVPYIRGAMLLDQRDRQQPVHTPRRLRELQQRARRHQERRRAAGLPPLAPAALAEALQCSLTQLEQAAGVRRALAVASLDQPLGDETGCWQEHLATPTGRADAGDDPQLDWLRQALAQLAPENRELLEGRWIDGLSWTALATQLGWSSQLCRQRALALMLELRQVATGEWPARPLQEPGQQGQANRARTAASAV
ncbi:MAG: sigma-70 family RNA polymerase sigma factor [Cyanobacteriota bacterium]|nr:sigma-70 family RNA polymerase sigma factor [Cyanobacteriota bacterium]